MLVEDWFCWQLLEATPDAMIIVDQTGTITVVNSQTEHVFGYTRTELLGQPIEMLVPERFRGQHPAHREAYFREPRMREIGPGTGMELYGLRKDGKEFPVDISLSPFQTTKGLWAISSIRDITQRKQLEHQVQERTVELQRSNQELKEFAYVAAHDLQEPLRKVVGYTQLLAEMYKGKLDQDADEFIAYAVDGATRMQTLIMNLLEYSRVGRKGKAFAATSCDSVLDLALANLREVVTESGAEVAREPLPVVNGDEGQLVQLFQNLLGNAIKFHGDQVPLVQVRAERKGDEWLFSVRDQGIGIDPKYAERIFVIFQRLHNRTEYPGTGIGLAICRKVVDRHGGRIWVESQLGHGSVFFFTLPA